MPFQNAFPHRWWEGGRHHVLKEGLTPRWNFPGEQSLAIQGDTAETLDYARFTMETAVSPGRVELLKEYFDLCHSS
jgi:hypothetical protein